MILFFCTDPGMRPNIESLLMVPEVLFNHCCQSHSSGVRDFGFSINSRPQPRLGSYLLITGRVLLCGTCQSWASADF